MPRRIPMIELKDIFERLKMGQSIKEINRELNRHKTVIRKVKRIAEENNWLGPDLKRHSLSTLTSQRLRKGRKKTRRSQRHSIFWGLLIFGDDLEKVVGTSGGGLKKVATV